jgi:hypothetical protein
MKRQQSIEDIKKAHPVDAMLFGPMGAVAAHLSSYLQATHLSSVETPNVTPS